MVKGRAEKEKFLSLILLQVLEEKYKFSAADAEQIASFLAPMLKFNPLQRASAQECLKHPWLAAAGANRMREIDRERERERGAEGVVRRRTSREGMERVRSRAGEGGQSERDIYIDKREAIV